MKLIMSWCPGSKCDPCVTNFGILGTFFRKFQVRFYLICPTGPPAKSDFSAIISMVRGTPAVAIAGTLEQELPGSLNWVANPPLPFTPINVPPDFDYAHIQMHIEWSGRPSNFYNITQFDWGELAISNDGGSTYNYNYAIV